MQEHLCHLLDFGAYYIKSKQIKTNKTKKQKPYKQTKQKWLALANRMYFRKCLGLQFCPFKKTSVC